MTSASGAFTEVAALLPAAEDPLALSANESPFAPLPSVQSALVASIGVGNRYPEILPERLRALIAGHVGLGNEQVIVGSGAAGVALQVLHALTSPGDRIVLASPTFDGYPILAEMARLTAVTVPLDTHGCHDLDAMAETAGRARLVVLCRPHNPTGTIESAAQVEQFLQRIPTDTVVMLDEAYVEFLAPELRLDICSLLSRYPNMVVLRTFSKAYGLAGLRIGYGLCAPGLGRRLWAMQMPYGTAVTSLVAVAACFRAEKQLEQRIRHITAERRYLQMKLRSVGVYSTNSHGNFVYLPPTIRPWRSTFTQSGLQVRHYPDGATRITVGPRTSTRAILAAVARNP
ncbi:histidinol-phosphate transaminase [soil metagenome]